MSRPDARLLLACCAVGAALVVPAAAGAVWLLAAAGPLRRGGPLAAGMLAAPAGPAPGAATGAGGGGAVDWALRFVVQAWLDRSDAAPGPFGPVRYAKAEEDFLEAPVVFTVEAERAGDGASGAAGCALRLLRQGAGGLGEDDRRVVEAWREAGLRCLRPGDVLALRRGGETWAFRVTILGVAELDALPWEERP